MKKLILLIIVLGFVNSLQAQKIQLELEQHKEGTALIVDVFIQSISEGNVELGSASFPFSDLSNSLILDQAKKLNDFDGEFSNITNPDLYSDFLLYAQSGYIHLMLLKNFTTNNLKGIEVPKVRSRLARISIPIKDNCGTSGLFWLTNSGTSITDYIGNDITADVVYNGPKAMKLTTDLVVPVIEQDGAELYVLQSASNYTWYKNGQVINEDVSSIIVTEEADYQVEISDKCDRKISNVYKVESITGIDEVSGLTMKLAAFPNPYQNETIIQYSLNSGANVKVEVFDVVGNSLGVLSNTYQSIGVYNIPFSANKKGYKPGVYLVKVTANELVLTQRIVELSR